MKAPLKSNQFAFTLLEIMLVVMIIALLAGAAISMMGGNIGVAEKVRIQSDVQAISTQLMIYRTQNGFYPSTAQGLQALVTQPSGDPQPTSWMKLIPEVPKDPYGQPYAYIFPGSHNPDTFDVYSLGSDGKDRTGDERGNWKDTSTAK